MRQNFAHLQTHLMMKFVLGIIHSVMRRFVRSFQTLSRYTFQINYSRLLLIWHCSTHSHVLSAERLLRKLKTELWFTLISELSSFLLEIALDMMVQLALIQQPAEGLL